MVNAMSTYLWIGAEGSNVHFACRDSSDRINLQHTYEQKPYGDI